MTQGKAQAGFAKPHYTMIPDAILDNLGGRPYPETLVLLYIARRTFGFGKQADAISLSQFIDGITTKDGKVLDTGCGIKGRRTLMETLKALEARGDIVAERTKRGNEAQTTVYRLALQEEGVVSTGHQVVSPGAYPSIPGSLPVVSTGHQQENSTQDNSTTRIPPTPLSEGGVESPPTSSGDAPGPAVVEEMATAKNDPTPPPPSPRADTVDNAVILDLRSRRKEKEALRSTGWHEYPDRLQRIKTGLEKGWTRKNPARFDRKALDMVARSVAPDEADRFEKKTVAYLKSVDDPQYLLSLRRWLEEWREREPERDRPMNQAEINSAWLLAMKPITREEIAQ